MRRRMLLVAALLASMAGAVSAAAEVAPSQRGAKPFVGRADMLIRKPVHEVFEAVANPAHTTRFWFTRSTGRLAPGKTVRWEWQMFGVTAMVRVRSFEPDRRIVLDWWSQKQSPTTMEWTFRARPDGTTFVSVVHSGFRGNADELARQAIDSTGGFTLVMAGLKAYLEHRISLNLVADHHPDRHR